jgi:hypothetical protein
MGSHCPGFLFQQPNPLITGFVIRDRKRMDPMHFKERKIDDLTVLIRIRKFCYLEKLTTVKSINLVFLILAAHIIIIIIIR